MRTETFPITVTDSGVTAKIYRATQTKNRQTYDGFLVTYSLLGKRKQVWRSELPDAQNAAREACSKVANGQQLVLTLTNTDRMEYLRASEALKGSDVPIDTACREYKAAVAILGGRAGLAEVCRDWIKRNATDLPRISVSAAVTELGRQAIADQKSPDRIKQINVLLGRFAKDINAEVHIVTPSIVSRWLTGLNLSERTRRNFRDIVGFFCRFCIQRGYLAKGTDWLEGVQKYSARKLGAIEIYTPDELTKLLRCAQKKFKAMVSFVAIGAFAGLRHAEIARLDWNEIDLSDTPGESFIEVRADKAKTETRRLVPIRDNLKSWLMRYRKKSGPVCPYANTTKQLLKLAVAAKVEWKRNALRHSCISYRVAECADVPRVAEESGNSVAVIRTNYLRRVKPAVAVEWFGIAP
jgi:integrase